MGQICLVMLERLGGVSPVRGYEMVADASEYLRLNPSVDGGRYYLEVVDVFSRADVNRIKNTPPYQVIQMDEVGGYSVVDYFNRYEDALEEVRQRGLRNHAVKRTDKGE